MTDHTILAFFLAIIFVIALIGLEDLVSATLCITCVVLLCALAGLV